MISFVVGYVVVTLERDLMLFGTIFCAAVDARKGVLMLMGALWAGRVGIRRPHLPKFSRAIIRNRNV